MSEMKLHTNGNRAMFYDTRTRLWTMYEIDSDGCQVGSAEYEPGGRLGREAAHRWLAEGKPFETTPEARDHALQVLAAHLKTVRGRIATATHCRTAFERDNNARLVTIWNQTLQKHLREEDLTRQAITAVSELAGGVS